MKPHSSVASSAISSRTCFPPRVAEQKVQRVITLIADAEIRADETQLFDGIRQRTRQLSDVFGVLGLEYRPRGSEPAPFSFVAADPALSSTPRARTST
jgi:hypothetical protein